MDKLTWTDTEEIGYQLFLQHAGVDPLSVRFTALHAWVLALPGFEGDPKKSNEAILEAIQMAWLEETED